MNFGLLILRLVVGAMFIGHGTQKLFGWFGGGGIEGTGAFFHKGGWRPGKVMAGLAGLSEAGGGSLLLLGLLTPLGSAAIIGMMTSAAIGVHRPNGFWNSNGGMEFPLSLAASAAALAFTGPGRYSIDRAIGLRDWGVAWGLIALVVGIVAGSVVLALRSANVRADARASRREAQQQHSGESAA